MTQRNFNPNSPFFHEERHASLALFADRLITICGAGTLGGNLVETLARMGFSRLILIDKDKVEMRNLSTQPYSRAEVGAPKARSLANMLYRAIQAKIEPVFVEVTSLNCEDLLRGSELIVDAFDNRAARAAVSETARVLHYPCLHIGFSPDGLYGSGLCEPDYEVPHDSPGDPCGYPLTRPMALVLTALAGRSICDYFSEGQSNNFGNYLRGLPRSARIRP